MGDFHDCKCGEMKGGCACTSKVSSKGFAFSLDRTRAMGRLDSSDCGGTNLRVSGISAATKRPMGFCTFPMRKGRMGSCFTKAGSVDISGRGVRISARLGGTSGVTSIRMLGKVGSLKSGSASAARGAGFLRCGCTCSTRRMKSGAVSICSSGVLDSKGVSLAFSGLRRTMFNGRVGIRAASKGACCKRTEVGDGTGGSLHLASNNMAMVASDCGMNDSGPRFGTRLLRRGASRSDRCGGCFSLLTKDSSGTLVCGLKVGMGKAAIGPAETMRLEIGVPRS